MNGLSKALAEWRSQADSVALVPTMGALHAGHMALVDEAARRAERVVATIFVNPLQFGEGEDLDSYPRQEEADLALLDSRGCDLVWLPRPSDLYPPGFATSVTVAGISERWEGESRPGHFAGVATVVTKLLATVRPDLAVFGEKDFQQLAVIRRVVRDLGLGVEILGVPTVRDSDGLALSSRNAYLTQEERGRALALPHALEAARAAVLGGAPVTDALGNALAALGRAGFHPIDYVALVDSDTLEPLSAPGGQMRIIAAATIGRTRLIDNLAVEAPAETG